MIVPTGLPFNFKTDWKCLFQKDTWFQYQRALNRDQIILKRFTVWNVFRFYFFKFIIAILATLLRPLIILAYKYWEDVEGVDTKAISGAMMRAAIQPPHWFRLGDEK